MAKKADKKAPAKSKKNAKGKKGGAAEREIRLSKHPRAQRQIGRLKS